MGVTHSVYEAVLAVLFGVQNAVFDEDGNSSQDERHKEVHVDEVPGAVQLPVNTQRKHPECHGILFLRENTHSVLSSVSTLWS